MNPRLLFLILAALGPAAAGFGAVKVVSDPRADYLRDFQCDDGDDLITSEIDLNNDGVDEVLITQRSLYNGRQGNIWVLYRSIPGGKFERLDELSGGGVLEFHPKATAFQERANGTGRDLVRYAPGGSGRGYVTTFELGPAGVAETVGRRISPGGEDEAFFVKTFENPGTRLVYEIRNVGELRAGQGGSGWPRVILVGALVAAVLALAAWKFGAGIFRVAPGKPRPR